MTKHRDLLARHSFALIDRAAVHQRPWHDSLPMLPLVPRELRSDESDMPALLALNPDEPYFDLLEQNLISAEENPSEHFLSCLLVVGHSVNIKILTAHLTSRLVLSSPQGKVFLRYYDHRVFPHLVRILSQPYLKSLFGPHEQVVQWTYRFQNDWITVPAPDTSNGVAHYWYANAETREKLEYTGLINSVLRKYSRQLKRPWQSPEEFEKYIDSAETAILLGQRLYHLSATEDLVAFGLHALKYGADFHRLDPIQRILHDEARRKLGDYAFTTEGFTHDEWAQITSETPFNQRI